MGTEEYLLDKARKEGEAKWRHEEDVEIARELKKEGLATDFIAKTTKLSVIEVQAL